jgi:hypothetical protein
MIVPGTYLHRTQMTPEYARSQHRARAEPEQSQSRARAEQNQDRRNLG